MVECKENWKVAEITILLHFTIAPINQAQYFLLKCLVTPKKRMVLHQLAAVGSTENASHCLYQLIYTLLKDKCHFTLSIIDAFYPSEQPQLNP